MQSLLSNVEKSQVLTDPFPHLVVENALPQDLYNRLLSEYPSLDVLNENQPYSSNQRLNYLACQSLDNVQISPLWREFVSLHTSRSFFREVINVFGDEILRLYPNFENYIGPLQELNSGVRKVDYFLRADVLLDALICANTPVEDKPSSVRRIHVDLPHKLFVGLFYLRHPEDQTEGADLELCRFKTSTFGFRGAEIDDRFVEVVKTIKYRSNVLVMFVNAIMALHGVTVRPVTPLPRYLFNLVGEVSKPLFSLGKSQERNMNKKGYAPQADTYITY